MTIEEVKQYVNKLEPNVMVLSAEYVNNREPLEFKCKCGKTFKKSWTNIQTHKSCLCRSCARKKGWKEKEEKPIMSKN